MLADYIVVEWFFADYFYTYKTYNHLVHINSFFRDLKIIKNSPLVFFRNDVAKKKEL